MKVTGFCALIMLCCCSVANCYWGSISLSSITNLFSSGKRTGDEGSCASEGCAHVPNEEEIESDENAYALTVADEEDTSLWDSVSNSLSNGLSVVKSTVVHTIGEKVGGAGRDFADKVREVLKDEVFTVVQRLLSDFTGLVISEDHLLGKVLMQSWTNVLTVIIIALCLILNYVSLSLRLTNCFFVLSFDALVFLLHSVFGPQWIFKKIFWIGENLYTIAVLVWNHYYIASGGIVVVFVLSIARPLIERYFRRRRSRKKQKQIDLIEDYVYDVRERMVILERNQEEILKLLRARDRDHVRD